MSVRLVSTKQTYVRYYIKGGEALEGPYLSRGSAQSVLTRRDKKGVDVSGLEIVPVEFSR